MKEEENNSVARSIGKLVLAFIPWALALGATGWFAFYVGVHQFRRSLSQEDRAAVYVGAEQRPKAKIKVEILPYKSCIHITKVDVSDDTLLLYAKNECGHSEDYFEWHWAALAPNGTIIKSNYENTASCAVPMMPGDSAECKITPDLDDRVQSIRVWGKLVP